MTLWDKEDMAVRMVLEEGKLNMCLRVLQGRSAHTPGADHAHPPPRRALTSKPHLSLLDRLFLGPAPWFLDRGVEDAREEYRGRRRE